MKVLVQRVLEASVAVDEETLASTAHGLLLMVCFELQDTIEELKKAAEKVSLLRIFEDENHKMNFNIQQVKGEVLSISQFTLSWDGSHGHRPSFDQSMPPAQARLFYHQFNKELKERGIVVKEGRFGAEMKVRLINDGPVTFMLNF